MIPGVSKEKAFMNRKHPHTVASGDREGTPSPGRQMDVNKFHQQ